MTEKEFLTLYKERRNLKSIREAKERLDSFWKALFDVLEDYSGSEMERYSSEHHLKR